jgi:hypothetical protein
VGEIPGDLFQLRRVGCGHRLKPSDS